MEERVESGRNESARDAGDAARGDDDARMKGTDSDVGLASGLLMARDTRRPLSRRRRECLEEKGRWPEASRGIGDRGAAAGACEMLDDAHLSVTTARAGPQGDPREGFVSVAIVWS